MTAYTLIFLFCQHQCISCNRCHRDHAVARNQADRAAVRISCRISANRSLYSFRFIAQPKRFVLGGVLTVKGKEVLALSDTVNTRLLLAFPSLKRTVNSNFAATFMDLNDVPCEIVQDVAEYYFASRAESEWVVLPVSNFDCFYGDTSFSKKRLSKIPIEILQREVRNGICRFSTRY